MRIKANLKVILKKLYDSEQLRKTHCKSVTFTFYEIELSFFSKNNNNN